MTSPREDVETLLRDLGDRLHVPDPADVTAAVLARLDEPAPAPTGWRPAHRVAAAALVLLAVLAAVMALSPTVRATVYDLLRIGGVEIVQNAPAPRASPEAVPLPGERVVTLAEAEAAGTAFEVLVPAALGEPDSVLLVGDSPPRVVSMSFATSSGEVRLDQFDGGLDPVFHKFATAADVTPVTVGSAPGVWVDRPHPVSYVDRDGEPRDGRARLAGSTLIWESDGVTYRVEGAVTLDSAIAIAESLR